MMMTAMVAEQHAVPVSEPAEPEVTERATRRVFSAQYELRILAEYERRDRNGKSALLRREWLYISSISEWRKQRDEGALQALGAERGRFRGAAAALTSTSIPHGPLRGADVWSHQL
jgi:transposase